MTKAETGNNVWSNRWTAAAEVMLIFLVFFLYAGWPPPDVNEAHYLAKAKHYWEPEWCASDHFLQSADAHLAFYWTLGWLTRLAPLPGAAWLGRFLTWFLLAWSWRRLSWAVIPRPFASLLTACGFLLFSSRFHMAGEWVVGGFEAKGIAYALVFFALGAILRQQWNWGWILLGAATSFHVLVGGWSLVAAGCAWLACPHLRPPLARMLPALGAALILTLPGLIPALLLNHGVGADVSRHANMIYVYGRLAHHLVFHRFPHWHVARFAILLVIWLVACRATACPTSTGALGQRPLRGFVGGAVCIAIVGIAIDQSLLHHLDVAAGLLRYYWYRLSDAMLPVGASLALVAWLTSFRDRRPGWGQAALVAAVLIAGGNLAWTNVQRRGDLRPGSDVQMLPAWPDDPARTRRTYEDWRETCDWIAEHTPKNACFITPRMQQTFKWYAARSEVCCWKDVPQDAAELVQWWQRQRELYPRRVVFGGLAAHGEQGLRDLAAKYRADYVVVDRYLNPRPLLLPRLYPSRFSATTSAYEIYQVPQTGSDR